MMPPSLAPGHGMATSAATQAWAASRPGRWGVAYGVLGLQRFWATLAATAGDQLSSDGGATFGHWACMVHGMGRPGSQWALEIIESVKSGELAPVNWHR